MKRIIIILLILLTCLSLIACGNKQLEGNWRNIDEEGNERSSLTDVKDTLQATENEVVDSVSITDDLDGYLMFVEKAEGMSIYVNDAIDASGISGLGYELLHLTILGESIRSIYEEHIEHGNEWEDHSVEKEHGVVIDTSTQKNDGVYTYTNQVSKIENASQLLGHTHVEYNSGISVLNKYVFTSDPDIYSQYQYYIDETGAIYFFYTEQCLGIQVIRMVYYDGINLYVAQQNLNDYFEFELLYDMTKNKPSSFEDLLVVDDYNLYLTYDGTTCNVDTDDSSLYKQERFTFELHEIEIEGDDRILNYSIYNVDEWNDYYRIIIKITILDKNNNVIYSQEEPATGSWALEPGDYFYFKTTINEPFDVDHCKVDFEVIDYGCTSHYN